MCRCINVDLKAKRYCYGFPALTSDPIMPEPNKRKVLFVITRVDELGGAQIHVFDLAQGLVRLGWQVDVVFVLIVDIAETGQI